MRTTVSSKGQIVLPASLREQDQIQPGQAFEVERVQAGEYVLRKIPQAVQPGLLHWLSECPGKDWFVPVESESTADL